MIPSNNNPRNNLSDSASSAQICESTNSIIDDMNGSQSSDSLDGDENYQPEISNNYSYPRKRKYTMTNRSKSSKVKNNNINPEDIIKRMSTFQCCTKKRCFRNLNKDYLCQKIRLYNSMSREDRKSTLHSMLASDNKFYFDGHHVCSTFLLLAFRFSRDLQSATRKGDDNSSCSKSFSAGTESTGFSNTVKSIWSQRETILSFLERLAESTGDRMPDSIEMHLPFFKKTEVFLAYTNEFKLLYPTLKPPSEDYFLRMWKLHCFHIKVRKHSRFTKCETCETLRMALHHAAINRKSTDELKDQKKRHLDFVRRERLEYKKNRDRAILQPSSCISLIVDGADQSAFGLPHFTTKVKSERGQAMKVKLVGVLQHAIKNKLRLFTLTEEHKTGANHIVEALHRTLMDIHNEKSLPKVLYIQVDNCSRENKNRFFLSYVESLVDWKVFDQITVGFLPIGHTHEDIDQSFSSTSERLRSNNAITLSDLHRELRSSYNDQTVVSRMENIVNWSGLCEQERCLTPVQRFSQYHYFRFFRGFNERPSPIIPTETTLCQVRIKCTDEWMSLHSVHNTHSFLKFAPKLERTPGTKVTCPPDVFNVTKRFESEEWRINSTHKIRELHNLRDEVFNTRFEPFSWSLSECIETRGGIDDMNDPVNKYGGTDCTRRNEFEYEVNSYVAVQQSENQAGFWIARILKVNPTATDYLLHVHWYEPVQNVDCLAAKYRPSYLNSSSQPKPWKDHVSDESVIVNFDCLTRCNQLPMTARKIIHSSIE